MICVIFQTDIFKPLHGDVTVLTTVAAEEMAFDAAHKDDVERGSGKFRIEKNGLRHIGDLAANSCRFAAEDFYRTMSGREKPENQLEQCRFSAAVGADHGGEHAVGDVKADVMENFSGVVGEAEMTNGYDGGSVHGKQ